MTTTPKGKLLQEAQRLTAGRTVDNIHKLTGIPTSWIRKFRTGTIQSPCVQRIELLIVKLSGKEII